MKITYDSILTLHEIQIRKDKKNFIVEDKITNEFYEMPEVCIEAIQLINNGTPLQEVEQMLVGKYPEEDINLLEFGNQLIELELVESINGQIFENHPRRRDNNFGFEWISTWAGTLFFNKFTKCFYLLVFVINIAFFFYSPSLFPHYKDVFVFNVMSLNILVYGVLSLVLLLIHEAGHILAIRSFGLATNLQIGHRLFLVVFETDLSQAWKIPISGRNFIYLAGICFDSVILFIALLVKIVTPFSSNIFYDLIGVVILDIVIRIGYQFCIYMKTDIYYVFENITGCYNLMESGIQFIRDSFTLKNRTGTNEIFKGEQALVRNYAIFYLLGVFLSLLLFVLYIFPQGLHMLSAILPGFRKPISSIKFWDATVFTIQVVIVLILLLNSYYRKYEEKCRKIE